MQEGLAQGEEQGGNYSESKNRQGGRFFIRDWGKCGQSSDN